MNSFQQTQELLDKLLPIPVDLPKIYLLGDTGAGKTTIIRQLLGTTKQRFPSVRRTRTTIAVTEYVISREPTFRAAIVFKPIEEIRRYVREILEDTIMRGYKAFVGKKLVVDDLVTNLEESPDQRFRLKFLVTEEQRTVFAKELAQQLIPQLSDWVEKNFPNEKDALDTVLELALEDGLSIQVQVLENEIMDVITKRILEVCSTTVADSIPKHFEITDVDLGAFLKKLKPLLDADDGSISPIVERARIRGTMSASWLPQDTEIVLIDGEGIGHDAKESNQLVLSSRHLDYFYLADAIMLVEDSERPFIAGGKSALVSLATNGYLSKSILAFSKIDKIEGRRTKQIQEVNRGLRNVLNALSEDQKLAIDHGSLDIRYLAKMDDDEPDDESKNEVVNLLSNLRANTLKAKPKYYRPSYDFELLAPFLDKATAEFRSIWDNYLSDYGINRKPWQTVKAFNFRMVWGQDDYWDMRPVADLHHELITKLEKFITSPTMWEEEVTIRLQQVSLERFKQEFSNQLVQLLRKMLIYENKQRWEESAALRGAGSTRVRASKITTVIHQSAPSMTEEHNKAFKDAIKDCFQKALKDPVK